MRPLASHRRFNRNEHEKPITMKDMNIKPKRGILGKIGLGSGLVVALVFLGGCKTNSSTGDQMKPMKGGEHQQMLNQ